MNAIANAATALAVNVVVLLLIPAALLYMLQRYVPFIGRPLWQLYQRLLVWCLVAPFRAVRALIRAATAHRR